MKMIYKTNSANGFMLPAEHAEKLLTSDLWSATPLAPVANVVELYPAAIQFALDNLKAIEAEVIEKPKPKPKPKAKKTVKKKVK